MASQDYINNNQILHEVIKHINNFEKNDIDLEEVYRGVGYQLEFD